MRKRRVTPFVENLRYARSSRAYELMEIGEECLNRLRHVRALSLAAHFPGDEIVVETLDRDRLPVRSRYLVYDVEWSRPDSYHYVVWQLTKSGRLFERGTMWLSPSRYVRIDACTDQLPDETRPYAETFRQNARTFIRAARDEGTLDAIVKAVQERQKQRGC